MIVVTGWSNVDQNSANEPVLLSRNAGDSWEVMRLSVNSKFDSKDFITFHHFAGRYRQSSNRSLRK
jgi:hypothetical protein